MIRKFYDMLMEGTYNGSHISPIPVKYLCNDNMEIYIIPNTFSKRKERITKKRTYHIIKAWCDDRSDLETTFGLYQDFLKNGNSEYFIFNDDLKWLRLSLMLREVKRLLVARIIETDTYLRGLLLGSPDERDFVKEVILELRDKRLDYENGI